MRFKLMADRVDMREGGEYMMEFSRLDGGYEGDEGGFQSSVRNYKIQNDADDDGNDSSSSDDCDVYSLHSTTSSRKLKVAARPSETVTPVKIKQSFQRLSTNDIVAARIRQELENRH